MVQSWRDLLVAIQEIRLLDVLPQAAVLVLAGAAAFYLHRLVARRTAADSQGVRHLTQRALQRLAFPVSMLVGLLPGLLEAMDSLAFSVGELRISLLAVVKLILLMGLVLVVAIWLSGIIDRRLTQLPYLSAGAAVGFSKVAKLVLITIAALSVLNLVGIDLTALAVFGGALGVGIGFGLQRIASNFISGFILVFDRSIRSAGWSRCMPVTW